MRRILSISLVVMLNMPCQAWAGPAYSWIDQYGNKIYGTNPPAGAKDVTSLKTRGLSHYSQDRVLARLKTKGKLSSSAAAGQTSAGQTSDPRASADDEQPQLSFEAASLEAGKVLLKHDERQRITECQVSVANKSESNAQSVSVAFEFADHTLVPASGPTEIAANSSADFALPADLLPLNVQVEDKEKKLATPRVIVHGLRGEVQGAP